MSGIVRKIDELGRIVIPKELRKSLNVKNGDDLEIKVVDNKIMLEKYYRLKSLNDIFNNYCQMLNRFLSSNYIITDKENIILASKELIQLKGLKLNKRIIELIDSRKPLLDNSLPILKIGEDIEVNNNYYFCPIIIDTDIIGSIILFNNKDIDQKEKFIVDIFLYLLKEKIE